MKARFIQTLILSLQMIVLTFVTSTCGQTEKTTTSTDNVQHQVQNKDNKDVKPPKENIHMAIISGHLDVVKQHIDAGTDLNLKDQMSGSTPLHTAITFNKSNMAELLIDAGTDLSIKNNEGSTALHNAVFFCRIDLVKILLDAGADKSIKNNYGTTAREIVMGDFKDMKPVYEMITLQLQPMGFQLDLEEVEKARPLVAMMLE